ncbi:E3 ubiquitin-protein ligase RHA1B-like [Populus alba x Populus x berolinensis]|nr:E3 ubiquitin-protein ligase RHA1B-like [Populus alba x Populus x berolinensis]
MGFPVGYSEVFLPKLFVHALSFLGFIRNLILCLFNYLGLSGFLETDNIWPDDPIRMSCYPPLSAALIREILPVIKFEDLVTGDGGCCDLPESCAVCLFEFEGEDEIRWLKNCKHIFHRACLDRWMDHDRKTCPLCRNSFVPDEMQEEFNQRLWAANNDDSDFYLDSAGFMFQQKHLLLVSFLLRKMFYKITIPKFQKLSLTMTRSISELMVMKMIVPYLHFEHRTLHGRIPEIV